MANIEFRLGSKTDFSAGRKEVLIRLYQGSRVNLRAHSGLYVGEEHFEYYINKAKTEAHGVQVPHQKTTATKAEAEKKGYVLLDRGEIVSKGRIPNEDKLYHDGLIKTKDELCKYIMENFNKEDIGKVRGDWLKDLVYRFNHPEKFMPKEKKVHEKSFFDMFELYLAKNDFSYDHTKAIRVLIRDLGRYEAFVRHFRNKTFRLKTESINRGTIEDFFEYLESEHRYFEDHPELYATLLEKYPVEIKTQRKTPKIGQRGHNTIVKLKKKFKAFFNWLYDNGYTKNRPFEGIKIGTERFSQHPFYLSKKELDSIYQKDLSSKPILERQRDIFVFQCMVGCRVGDLMRLTRNKISDNRLSYVPGKTKTSNPMVVRVPINQIAASLIKKYENVDCGGFLFPFITPQKYNEAIKKVLTECGITRMVTVLNPTTGEEEQRPINEIAGSHLARRTFVGLLYERVPDPNLIAPLSGHTYNSKAFNRYKDVTDSMADKLVAMLE